MDVAEDRPQYVKDNPTDKQALYNVVYVERATNDLSPENNLTDTSELTKQIRDLKLELSNLLQLKNKNDKLDEGLKNSVINKFVFRYLSEFRYFFKSSDYHFERELRVVKYYLPNDYNVKVDMNSDVLPRRIYIESSRYAQHYISRIILGPKVPHPERWMYLEVLMNKVREDFKLMTSECKFQ